GKAELSHPLQQRVNALLFAANPPWRRTRGRQALAWGKPALKGYCILQMASAPQEEDLISDLRATFADDVADSPTSAESAPPARAVVAPPPLPSRRTTGDRRPAPSHALEDPFQERAEPRMPHGLPEEKVEYFRVVLKQKQETLARARAVYAQREAELHSLNEAIGAARAHLDQTLAALQGEQQRSKQFEG